MILLGAAMLCACGRSHKETNDLVDTTKDVGHEVSPIAPDTVVGRFIEPNWVDTLLFMLYSEKKTYSHEENVEYVRSMLGVHTDGLEDYSAEELDTMTDGERWTLLSPYGMLIEIEECSDEQIDTIANRLRRLNMRLTPYTSLDSIIQELNALWELRYEKFTDGEYSYDYKELCTAIALNRTEFHLQNPITWHEYSPTETYCPLRVTATPDGKHKFYVTPSLNDGTMRISATFHQYELDGNVECELWGGKYWQSAAGVKEAWQFDYHDSTFYVLQRVYVFSSCDCALSMDIVTFGNDGTLKNHDDRFIPNNQSGFVATTSVGLPIGYTFDLETLTVTARTQEGDRLVTKKWKLKLD